MKNKLAHYQQISRKIRRSIVRMHARSHTSHVGSALSCVDILVSLYFAVLKIYPKNPDDRNRDKFILSKGHSASALYATLAHRGFFDSIALERYCISGGTMGGHSTRASVPGVETSTGSLGHGLSMGAGMALAAKNDNVRNRIFVLLSDGECEEGSVWEAALFATQHHLDNLVAIVDYNKIQALGFTNKIINLEPLKRKWQSFGWQAEEVDGHDFMENIRVLKKNPFKKNKPSVIIAHTIKGKGVSFMENKLEWHYRSPNEAETEQALKELA